jgi:hypothetical protein
VSTELPLFLLDWSYTSKCTACRNAKHTETAMPYVAGYFGAER